MPLEIESIDHVQITVPPAALEEAMTFYGTILGFAMIEKPKALRKNGGAWYRHGSIEIHLSPEDGPSDLNPSKRHICYVVPSLAAAETELRRHRIEIIPDHQRISGWIRFYIRDPGGNRIEIAQRNEQAHTRIDIE
jgi:catechol 2,3-dioxygenase-like lactoylglutathione lyase family enzyme